MYIHIYVFIYHTHVCISRMTKNQTKEPYIASKEPYIASKEPYIFAKEHLIRVHKAPVRVPQKNPTFAQKTITIPPKNRRFCKRVPSSSSEGTCQGSAKEPYISAKEYYSSAKEHYISAKDYISAKEYLNQVHMAPAQCHKRALHLRIRALPFHKRARYFGITVLYFHKRASEYPQKSSIFGKRVLYVARGPTFPQKASKYLQKTRIFPQKSPTFLLKRTKQHLARVYYTPFTIWQCVKKKPPSIHQRVVYSRKRALYFCEKNVGGKSTWLECIMRPSKFRNASRTVSGILACDMTQYVSHMYTH